MKTQPNDPINPTPIAGGDNSVVSAEIISTTFPGLTKREYLAAMALQGIVSNPEINRRITEKHPELTDLGRAEAYTNTAVICADKLIEELNK